jgi:hypothetical protein
MKSELFKSCCLRVWETELQTGGLAVADVGASPHANTDWHAMPTTVGMHKNSIYKTTLSDENEPNRSSHGYTPRDRNGGSVRAVLDQLQDGFA